MISTFYSDSTSSSVIALDGQNKEEGYIPDVEPTDEDEAPELPPRANRRTYVIVCLSSWCGRKEGASNFKSGSMLIQNIIVFNQLYLCISESFGIIKKINLCFFNVRKERVRQCDKDKVTMAS